MSAARRNNASRATFTQNALDRPFASGSFRWVAKGVYTEGDRANEPCVCKWFKTGGVLESRFYDTDIKTSNKAIEIVSKWNDAAMIDRNVQINLPEVWTFNSNCRSDFSNRKVLQEPFITDYQKFNSNTGWADSSVPWNRVMQALSHYSYHVMGGRMLLCDLQGGVYQDGVVLTDPVINSMSREYGPTDLGREGISSFFAHHVCNEYCRSNWQSPKKPTSYYRATAHTTMKAVGGNRQHVPTRGSRAPMTFGNIPEY